MKITVIGVFIFILFVISSQWVLIYEPLNFFNNIWGQTYIILYHILGILLLRCYWMSIITNAGSPPSNWIPEGKTKEDLNILVEQFKNYNNSINSKNGTTKNRSTTVLVDDNLSTITVLNSKSSRNNNKARFCSQCCAFKPPRTHHCKSCKRCILKQDHHCPWINNCTGFRNQKFFIQFLFYVVLLSTITIITLTISGFYILNVNLNPDVDESKATHQRTKVEESDEIQFILSSAVITILYIFNFSGVIPVLLGVLGLFFYQMEFLLSNYTPCERSERKKEGKIARKNGLKYQWKYDKGWKLNFKEVMGDSKLQWFLPIGYPKTDGTFWRENELYLQQQKILNNQSDDLLKQPLLLLQQNNLDGATESSIEINDYISRSSSDTNNNENQQQQQPSFGFVENV